MKITIESSEPTPPAIRVGDLVTLKSTDGTAYLVTKMDAARAYIDITTLGEPGESGPLVVTTYTGQDIKGFKRFNGTITLTQ